MSAEKLRERMRAVISCIQAEEILAGAAPFPTDAERKMVMTDKAMGFIARSPR